MPPALAPSRSYFPLRWAPLPHWPRAMRPSAGLCHWLTYPGSLTAQLQALSLGDFSVQVLRQQLALPKRDEAQLLGQAYPQLALVREVLLCGQGEHWVFARSLLPLTSLTGKLRLLRRQGTQPLGKFLFRHHTLVRGNIEVAPITPGSGYMPEALFAHSQQPLWGRRSVFSLWHKPLLVSEVFLPAFNRHLISE